MNKGLTAMILALGALAMSCSRQPPPPRNVLPYVNDKRIDNIRVMLVRLSRNTEFSSEGIQTNDKTIHSIPTITVVFLVEFLGNETIRKNSISFDLGNVFTTNKTSKLSYLNIIPAQSSESHAYDHYPWGLGNRPPVTDSSRAFILTETSRGVYPPGFQVNLSIGVRFNDQHSTFNFDKVPIY